LGVHRGQHCFVDHRTPPQNRPPKKDRHTELLAKVAALELGIRRQEEPGSGRREHSQLERPHAPSTQQAGTPLKLDDFPVVFMQGDKTGRAGTGKDKRGTKGLKKAYTGKNKSWTKQLKKTILTGAEHDAVTKMMFAAAAQPEL
jgi:hypothetical protein